MLLIYIETLIIDYSLSREGRVTLCTESQSIKGTVDLNCKNTIGVCFGPREENVLDSSSAVSRSGFSLF